MNDIKKIVKLISETTTAGSVASVVNPLETIQKRDEINTPQVLEYGNWENSSLTANNKLKNQRKKSSKVVKSVYGENKNNKKVMEGSLHDEFSDFIDQLKKSGKLKPVYKGNYSSTTPAVKSTKDELLSRLNDLESRFDPAYDYSDDYSFWTKQKEIEAEINSIKEKLKNYVKEDTLEETDLIINPSSISKKAVGLISPDTDRQDHEIEMAKSDLYQSSKNALEIFNIIKNISEDQGLEGWVQEKIIKANDYLNTVREYLQGKQLESSSLTFESSQPKVRKYSKKRADGSIMQRWEVLDCNGKRVKEFDSADLAKKYLKQNKFDLMYTESINKDTSVIKEKNESK